MKRTLIIFFLFFTLTTLAQYTEFGKSSNGLIYPDTTIKQLKFIVDSLNLKFRVCELNRSYKSKLQAKANYVGISGAASKRAKKDMQKNISFNDFIKKYTEAEIDRELLVVKFKYKNYSNEDEVQFVST
ncbi:MAG TPA: hypothetical protein VFF27_18390, partial [Bacteroidia bacterium]|nr:hypothetical protein [Bacteroidia bacterium]